MSQLRSRVLVSSVLCVAALLFAICGVTARPLRISAAITSKISPWVNAHASSNEPVEFLVVLADQADVRGAKLLQTKADKGRFVRDTLWRKAQTTQGPLLKFLQDRHIEYRAFYIVNMIWVRAPFATAQRIAARSDVARIEANPHIQNALEPTAPERATAQPEAAAAIEPGITYSHAPDVWAMGFTGQGIVVASADTGHKWDHEALKKHYRGYDPITDMTTHDYSWHDSIHPPPGGGGTNPCGYDLPEPCDDNSHGTHTIGTAVGDDGNGNQIGMAPGAKWIGCRNMDANDGTPTRYIECMEYFLAPYPVGGSTAQGDPAKAPDISTNSWSCPTSEGCSVNELQAAADAQRAAGIMMVAAAGNAGNNGINDCSTVNEQPGTLASVYSIGALNTGADTAASFSSKGPVTLDGSNRLKPDLSAPGTNTRSCTNASTTSYGTKSGTSMATPHVSGAIALLWSAQPALRDNVDATEAILNQSAVHLNSPPTSLCDPPLTTWPNNTFGYGRLDVKAAVDRALLLPRIISAVSRKIHNGTPYDVDLPFYRNGAAGIECRSSGGNHTLVFTFDRTVVSGNATVTSGTANISGAPVFNGTTMTVNLTGVADAQRVTLKLSNVTDNTAQVLPDTSVTMGVLSGDTNADGAVDSADISETKSQSGSGLTNANFREDVNVDGGVNSADISFVKSRSGTALP